MADKMLSQKEKQRLTENLQQLKVSENSQIVFGKGKSFSRSVYTDRAISENQMINELLEKSKQLNLPESVKENLMLREGRNKSFLLLADSLSGGDSPEMSEVKRCVKELEVAKQKPFIGGFSEEAAMQVSDIYDKAILACDKYINKKGTRPVWPSYAKRYDMVMENRKRFAEEKLRYEQQWRFGANKELTEKAESAEELLNLSRFKKEEAPLPKAPEKEPVITRTKDELIRYCADYLDTLRAKALFRIDNMNVCRRVMGEIALLDQKVSSKLNRKIKDSYVPKLRKELDDLFADLERKNQQEYDKKYNTGTAEELEKQEEMEKKAYNLNVLTIMEEEGLSNEEAAKLFMEERLEAKRPFTMLHLGEATEDQKENYKEFDPEIMQKIKRNMKDEFPDAPDFTLEQVDEMIKSYTNAVFNNVDFSYQIRVCDPNTIGLILNAGRFKSQLEGNVAAGGGTNAMFDRKAFTAEKYGVNYGKIDKGKELQEIYTKLAHDDYLWREYKKKDLAPEEKQRLLNKAKSMELLPSEQYEIYGYLSHGDLEKEVETKGYGYGGEEANPIKAVEMYGQVIVKLKPERIKEKVTMLIGDSLNARRRAHPVKAGAPMGVHNCAGGWPEIFQEAYKYYQRKQDPNYDPKKDKELSLEKLVGASGEGYVELQFHGGVSAEDIESVAIDGDSDDFVSSAYVPHKKLPDHIVNMLREKGIKAYNINGGKMTEARTLQDDLLSEYARMKDELKNSKKGGFLGYFRSNSPQYDAVVKGMGEVYQLLSKTRFTNPKEINSTGLALLAMMKDTHRACQTYMEKTGGESTYGIIRKQLVEKTMLSLSNDIANLQSGLQTLNDGGESVVKGFSWAQMLRTREINVSRDLKSMKHVGNSMSDLIEIKKTDDPMGGGFFKEEEKLKLQTPQEVLAESKKRAMKKMEQDGYPITLAVMNTMESITDTKKIWTDSKDPMALLAVEYLREVFLPMMRQVGNMRDMGMQDKGGGIDLADRDVASYKVASLFGLGNLIAKSEKTTIKNWGAKYNGHLMQKASGQEGVEFLADHLEKKEGELKDKLTSSFVRDLNNLMILDYICGQKDRHIGNYFVQKGKDGKLISVMGIDNNLAFGANKDYDYSLTYLPIPVSEDGKLLVKHMDRQLADTIITMKPEFIKMQLSGLLTEGEINLALERLAKLQQAIIREMESGDPSVFVNPGEDWLAYADELTTLKSEDGGADGECTYLDEFLNSKMTVEKYNQNRQEERIGRNWLEENKNMTAEQLIRSMKKLVGEKKLPLLDAYNFLEQKKGEQPFSPAERIINKQGLSPIQCKQCDDLIKLIGRAVQDRQ